MRYTVMGWHQDGRSKRINWGMAKPGAILIWKYICGPVF